MRARPRARRRARSTSGTRSERGAGGCAGTLGGDRLPEAAADEPPRLFGWGQFRPRPGKARGMLAAYEAGGDARGW